MSKAAREEEITLSVKFWNQKKINMMAKSLAKKHAKMKNEIEIVEPEILGNCRQLGIDVTTLPQWVKEITEFASGYDGQADNDQGAIMTRLETLSFTIQQRRHVMRQNERAKHNTVLRSRNERDTKAVAAAIVQLHDVTPQIAVTTARVLEGNFPWLVEGTATSHTTAEKRKVAELHQKLMRLKEEMLILETEMKQFITYYENQLVKYMYCDLTTDYFGCTHGEACNFYCIGKGPLTKKAQAGAMILLQAREDYIKKQLQTAQSLF
ncbi:PREDICTED: uncharacterized protein LOC106817124 [Priapulus caudatus]|uniref:Uncharacterized protein LOC106817124 n=1 Tax=Priapulus caudatus TaxID=37621 RepID=A0ABM1EYI6_PRICU|nr:PREDICTED: uncharacterized protein LOC106817124 [Priapulus caudatus]